MPTRLPSGLLIYNATKHDMLFWVEGTGIVNVPYDYAISARPVYREVASRGVYNLLSIKNQPTDNGWRLIKKIRKEYPDAIIVGSAIAAISYPGEVYAAVKLRSSPEYGTHEQLFSASSFLVYERE
jgi:hypothetical protein